MRHPIRDGACRPARRARIRREWRFLDHRVHVRAAQAEGAETSDSWPLTAWPGHNPGGDLDVLPVESDVGIEAREVQVRRNLPRAAAQARP